MGFTVRLRVAGTLIDVARVLRVLKRHRSERPSLTTDLEGNRTVAVLVATVGGTKRINRLLEALARIPTVLDTVILGQHAVPLNQ